MRLARDCGNISSLFPPGITRLVDLPHTLHTAIRTALYFLKFEELEKPEYIPPKHIWLDPEKMKEWWAWVKQSRKDEMEGNGTSDMPQNQVLAEMFPGVKFG